MQLRFHRSDFARDQRLRQLDRIALDHEIEETLAHAEVGLLLSVFEQLLADFDLNASRLSSPWSLAKSSSILGSSRR